MQVLRDIVDYAWVVAGSMRPDPLRTEQARYALRQARRQLAELPGNIQNSQAFVAFCAGVRECIALRTSSVRRELACRRWTRALVDLKRQLALQELLA